MSQPSKGSLVCVGLGMTLGSHITPLSRSYIEQADIVYLSASDSLVEEWVNHMNPNVVSLQSLYQEGLDRRDTYSSMVDWIMQAVRAGKRVVGAFYGHPGVFAWAPHEVIRQARAEGFAAHMEAGISAEACLYADVGIDPGQLGLQHLEATQLLVSNKIIDSSGYLILWQIGNVGDRTRTVAMTDNRYRALLAQRLMQDYPAEHAVILYEAAVLPVETARIESIPLGQLGEVEVKQYTTLIVPPSQTAQPDRAMLRALDELDKQ